MARKKNSSKNKKTKIGVIMKVRTRIYGTIDCEENCGKDCRTCEEFYNFKNLLESKIMKLLNKNLERLKKETENEYGREDY